MSTSKAFGFAAATLTATKSHDLIAHAMGRPTSSCFQRAQGRQPDRSGNLSMPGRPRLGWTTSSDDSRRLQPRRDLDWLLMSRFQVFTSCSQRATAALPRADEIHRRRRLPHSRRFQRLRHSRYRPGQCQGFPSSRLGLGEGTWQDDLFQSLGGVGSVDSADSNGERQSRFPKRTATRMS